MIDLDKPCEGLDYEILPFEVADNEQAWVVKVLRGTFANTMLGFTAIEFDGKSNRLKFRLDAIRDDDLDVTGDDLQDHAFNILQDIIRNGIANGSIVFDDKDTSNGTVAGTPRLSFNSERE